MKNVLYVLFLFLSQGLLAQSECDTLKGHYSNYIYRKYTSSVYRTEYSSFIVYAEGSKLDNADQGNFPMYPRPTLFLRNMKVLNQLLKENIKPYIEPSHIDFGEIFKLDLYFNEKGEILELYFTYRHELKIPVVAIENLDRGIKESCYIAISGSKAIFEGANFHRFVFAFPLEDIFNENLPDEDLKIRLWW
ncbi:MAG: hypothetical protein IJD84_09080 [Parabacteroides sp.]|nr:hypothetical protein [Parabacteroides sp.]